MNDWINQDEKEQADRLEEFRQLLSNPLHRERIRRILIANTTAEELRELWWSIEADRQSEDYCTAAEAEELYVLYKDKLKDFFRSHYREEL